MRIPVRRDFGWSPLATERCYTQPAVGQLIAYKHGVWRVTDITDLPLDEEGRQVWEQQNGPDLETWGGRPLRLALDWVGGVLPESAKGRTRGTLDTIAGKYPVWHVYPSGRWPQCSCCGEPMPCRTELQDQEVARSLDRIMTLESIAPGACWACHEVITTRQKSIVYPGENLDLPGGQQPRFHTRAQCAHSARAYEERWLAVDPRRERILTYPDCGGALIVHADGSSECVEERSPLGDVCEPQPDCRGHFTHDHAYMRSCTARDGGCPRGCAPSGMRPSPRPERRQTSDGLFQ